MVCANAERGQTLKSLGNLIALSLLLLSSCAGPPTPESYGIYARERRTLQPLNEGSPIRLGKESEFIVFDKVIGSGPIGGGSVDLKEVFSVHHSAIVRYDVERVKDPRSSAITEIHITNAGQWLPLDESVNVSFAPIRGQTEMLLIRPAEQLSDGLYALRIDSKIYPFAVGLAPEQAPQSTVNRCKDKHSDGRPQSSTFSWSDFLNTLQQTGQSSHGNWLESTGYLDCSALDNEAKGWREAATSALSNGQLQQAFGPARLFAAYDAEGGRELLQSLSAALQRNAQQAFDAERWGEATDLASLGLTLDGGNPVLQRIASEARQRSADIAAAEKAAAEARYAARVRASQTATKTLGHFTVISDKSSTRHGLFPNASHPIEVTDVSIRGLAYLSDSGWITSTNKLEDEYWFCWISEGDVGPAQAYRGKSVVRIPFRNRWSWAAVFNTDAERARFVELLQTAKQAWYSQYGDLIVNGKCPS